MSDQNFKKYRFLFFILLSIGIISGFSKNIEKAGSCIVNIYKTCLTRQDLILIKNHLDMEKEQLGLYPPAHRFSHWFKESLSEKLEYNFPIDRWGKPYIYKTINERHDFVVSSSGKDMVHETKDDIKITSIKPELQISYF